MALFMLSWRACHPPGTTRTEPFSPIRKGSTLPLDTTSVHVCVCLCFITLPLKGESKKWLKINSIKVIDFFVLLLFSVQCRDRNKSRATASETACQGSATLSKSTSPPPSDCWNFSWYHSLFPFSWEKKNFKDKECKVAGIGGVKWDTFNERLWIWAVSPKN